MRPAHTLSSFVLAACTAAALPVGAQTPTSAALRSATDPAAATVLLPHRPLPTSGGIETAKTDWRSAHEAVAAFPRGHADILVWEAAQARAADTPAAAQPKLHQHPPVPRPGVQP